MPKLQLKQRRQVHRQPREINDDGQRDDHNKNEGKDCFRNFFQGYVGDVADNVKIHRHRRSQLADSQVDCHDNAEPDGVPVEDLDERNQHGGENVVDGNRIHEHSGNKMLLLLGGPIVYGTPLLLTKSINTGILIDIWKKWASNASRIVNRTLRSGLLDYRKEGS